MKLYKSCNTLPIARFFRIFETDDLRNLIVDFDFENDNIVLTVEQTNDFYKIFQDIYYEYSDLTQNYKARATIRKEILIHEWSFIYKCVSNLINLYMEYKDIQMLELINELKDTNYKIDFEKPIDKQVKILVMKMKGLKNKIKIFKSKLAESLKTDKEQVKADLYQDALYLERNLELKRDIDPETTSILKWIKLIQMNKEKQKENGRNKNKHRASSKRN